MVKDRCEMEKNRLEEVVTKAGVSFQDQFQVKSAVEDVLARYFSVTKTIINSQRK